MLHTPPAGVRLRGQVLYLHPWAEEMNKARRMAALQAAALASAGFRVLQIDLHGCGDSSDTWAEASWAGWVDDAVHAARWLTAHAAHQGQHAALGAATPPATTPAIAPDAGPSGAAVPLWLWGLRAGALLASAAAERLPVPCHFIFWQPTPAGKPLLQQFLRLKGAAASLAEAAAPVSGPAAGAGDGGPAGAKAAIDAVRRALAAGQVQHIAGYPLAPALAQGLEAATLSPPPPGSPVSQVLWFEVSNRPEATLLPASAPAVQAWRAAGHSVHSEVVPGPAFWQTQEIEDAPALLAATVRAMAAVSAMAEQMGHQVSGADQPRPATAPLGQAA